MLAYLLQGLFHPARRVRETYWRLYNSLYVGSAGALVAFYPQLDAIGPQEGEKGKKKKGGDDGDDEEDGGGGDSSGGSGSEQEEADDDDSDAAQAPATGAGTVTASLA